jgi:Uma2 family endonuclease
MVMPAPPPSSPAPRVTARRFTVDEVLAWPNDGNRYELVDGVLLVTPAPVPVHQVVAWRLADAIGRRARTWPDVYVATPGGILIRPGTTMEPDILVFHTPSLQLEWEEIHDHWLAVEVFSPSSVVYDRDIKRDAYLQLGVGEVWLADVGRKTIFASHGGKDGARDQAYDRILPWRPPLSLEPEAIDLAEIFAGLD